jgi:hypothetical protein
VRPSFRVSSWPALPGSPRMIIRGSASAR